MDKEKIKSAIQKVMYYSTKISDADYDLLMEALIELDKPDWVSVEERLPNMDEKVLVCNKDFPYSCYISFRDSNIADMWKDKYGFLKEEHVTHWKPIEELDV